jgi:hypothetical protein
MATEQSIQLRPRTVGKLVVAVTYHFRRMPGLTILGTATRCSALNAQWGCAMQGVVRPRQEGHLRTGTRCL